jgi:hypothetical protein
LARIPPNDSYRNGPAVDMLSRPVCFGLLLNAFTVT